MNKIGIITITRDENYGNRLQNYAVQEVLKKLGFSPETIINHTSNGFSTGRSITTFIKKLQPKHIIKVLKTRLKNKLLIKNEFDGILRSFFWKRKFQGQIIAVVQQRKKAFAKFNAENIIFSNTPISLDNIEKVDLSYFDYFVCGSDQIWNPYYPQNSMIDFLCFAPETKRIAYAPSFGVGHIPERKRGIYREWLLNIPSLSIREELGAAIIKELTGREATVLVDPTLMLSRDEWMGIAKKPTFAIEQRYILTYFLGNETKAYRKAINDIAEMSSYRVINLADIREFESYAVDPGEFVWLIHHAELICTDSFHGAVIAIIMKTNFIVFDRFEDGHSMGSRLDNLLKKFSMEDRHFKNIKKREDAFKTNFRNADEIISIEQNKAWNFLGAAIK